MRGGRGGRALRSMNQSLRSLLVAQTSQRVLLGQQNRTLHTRRETEDSGAQNNNANMNAERILPRKHEKCVPASSHAIQNDSKRRNNSERTVCGKKLELTGSTCAYEMSGDTIKCKHHTHIHTHTLYYTVARNTSKSTSVPFDS